MTNILQQAWRARIEQRYEQALDGYVEVASALGLSIGAGLSEDAVTELCRRHDFKVVIDVVLLRASLRRMQGAFDQAKELIGLCERVVLQLGVDEPFRLLFEKGLNLFIKGDFVNALDCFLVAAKKTDDSQPYGQWERLCAQVNGLLCLENLGISGEGTLEKVEAGILQLGAMAGEGILSQLHAYRLREEFRKADLKNFHAEEQTAASGQAEYYKIWVSRLPYHRHTTCSEVFGKQMADFVTDQEVRLFMKNFRLRTLQGIQHVDDQSPEIKPSELVDRLYLWTWYWLCDPDEWPLSKVMSLVESVAKPEFQALLTVEDKQLLTNALSWLDLFDRENDRAGFIQALRAGVRQRAPIYEFEYLCIAYLRARSHHDPVASDFYLQLCSHPLWEQDELYFRQLIEAIHNDRGPEGMPGSGLKILHGNLCQLVGVEGQAGAEISVDFSTFKITNHKTDGLASTSESMCRAMEFTSKYRAVSKENFCCVSFGLRRFDAVVHDQKVYNLLQRLNKVCHPTLRFTTKEGRVFVEGDWDRVGIINRQVLSDQLQTYPEWLGLFSTEKRDNDQKNFGDKHRTVIDKIPSHLSTKHLQEILGKSRATTNRLIKGWEKKKLVTREGRARSSTLVLSEKLIDQIMKSQQTNNSVSGGPL